LVIREMAEKAEFIIHPELQVRGEPYRGFRSLSDSRRTIRTIDQAVAFAREHREGRDAAHREAVICRLESATTREQKLDAVNTFRAWLESENLLFPTGF
jgi:hypothetical protein